jgi:hypothetical protein
LWRRGKEKKNPVVQRKLEKAGFRCGLLIN